MGNKITADDIENNGGALAVPLEGGVRLITWYTPSGKKLRLPSDAWSIQKYALKGFTLKPPKYPEPEKVSGVGVYDDEPEEEKKTGEEGEQLSFLSYN